MDKVLCEMKKFKITYFDGTTEYVDADRYVIGENTVSFVYVDGDHITELIKIINTRFWIKIDVVE